MAFHLRNTYTAIVTPFSQGKVDGDTLDRLIGYQNQNGCGILANGTTGETPTLTETEQGRILSRVLQTDPESIAGTGGNDTKHAMDKTGYAVDTGAQACLLVDCYYLTSPVWA